MAHGPDHSNTDRMRYKISIDPIECATGDGSVENFVISGTVGGSVGCSSQEMILKYATYYGDGSGHGNASRVGWGGASVADFGKPYILSAPAATAGQAMPAGREANCMFMYIENTGWQQAADGAYEQAIRNEVDYLTVEALDNGTILAVLMAGEGIILPCRGTTDSTSIFVSSTEKDGLTAGANTLGVKYLKVSLNAGDF